MISITLDQKDYRHVAATLAARYGAPTETSTRQLQNRMGAAVESEVVTWSGTESRLHGNQHDGRMDESSITFRMNDHMRKFAERKKRSSSGSVKDL